MNTVIQQEKTGCGLACVAMLAGKSYDEVKRKANSLGIFFEDEKLWSKTDYVRRLLDQYNIKVSGTEVPFSTWEELPSLALLAIKFHYENSRPFWHWTVYHRTGTKQIVHDPAAYLVSNQRTDFENMAPKWSIAIHK